MYLKHLRPGVWILLLSIALLAGCAEEDRSRPFALLIHNETSLDLGERYFINGEYAGLGGSVAGGASWTNFGCPSRTDGSEAMWGPTAEFTLSMDRDVGGEDVFAQATQTVWCDFFTAWVHPDGYIVFEEGRIEGEPPWSRS